MALIAGISGLKIVNEDRKHLNFFIKKLVKDDMILKTDTNGIERYGLFKRKISRITTIIQYNFYCSMIMMYIVCAKRRI